MLERSKGRKSTDTYRKKNIHYYHSLLRNAHSIPSSSYPLYVAIIIKFTLYLNVYRNTNGIAKTQQNLQPFLAYLALELLFLLHLHLKFSDHHLPLPLRDRLSLFVMGGN